MIGIDAGTAPHPPAGHMSSHPQVNVPLAFTVEIEQLAQGVLLVRLPAASRVHLTTPAATAVAVTFVESLF